MILAFATGDETLLERFWCELCEIWGLAAFRDIESLRRGLPNLSPNAVIVDLETGRLEDLRSLRSLCRQFRHIPFIAAGNVDHVQSEIELLRTGLRGRFRIDAPPSLYGPMLDAVLRGELWFSRKAISLFLEELGLVRPYGTDRRAMAGGLSGRELQVARLAISGASNKQISHELHITVRTVKAHLSNIFGKLGISQRSELFSLDERLLSPSTSEARPS